jgi:hypothetical protein
MHIKCIVQSRKEKKRKKKEDKATFVFMIDKVEPTIRTNTSFKKKKNTN